MNDPLDFGRKSGGKTTGTRADRGRLTHWVAVVTNALRDQTGSGLAEYGLLLVLILVVSLTILGTIGGTIANLFTQVNAGF